MNCLNSAHRLVFVYHIAISPLLTYSLSLREVFHSALRKIYFSRFSFIKKIMEIFLFGVLEKKLQLWMRKKFYKQMFLTSSSKEETKSMAHTTFARLTIKG